MSRFTTTANFAGYDVTLEVTYRCDGPVRQCRDSGAWEGGVEVESVRVLAAYGTDDDGEAAGPERVAELQALLTSIHPIWAECQGEAERHYEAMCVAAGARQ